MIETDGSRAPDLPDGFEGTATLTDDGDYLLIPADIGAEVESLRDRLDAVAAKADEASVTAQELADAARERKP